MATDTATKAATEKTTHHIGADIEKPLFAALQCRARRDMVPYAVVIRWALADFLAATDNEDA